MDENQLYINKIRYLVDYLTLDASRLSGITLVHTDKLIRLIESLPSKTLDEIMRAVAQNNTPSHDDTDFKEWVIRNRTLKNMSQSELARTIGVRPEQICRYEKGTHPLSEDHLLKIRSLLLNESEN